MKKLNKGFLNVKEKIYETYDESTEIIHAFICENNDENLIKEETAKALYFRCFKSLCSYYC